jgi:hypothetical protein
LPILISATPAWDGSEGVLWVHAWDERDPGALEPYRGDGWLLAYTEDLAVLLSPPGVSASLEPSPLLTRLGPIESSLAYYLFLVRDAEAAEFLSPGEVLFRKGNTVVLRTGGSAPVLAPESRESLRGLQQPVRITMSPKPWPSSSSGEGREPLIDFDPLVDHIVAEVLESEYVAVWQALDDFETRYTFTQQNEWAATYLHDVMALYGLQTEYHSYYQSGWEKTNVIGTLPGLDPTKVVYMCGHFDSISEDPENHAPGADDNASGTAAFLEAARILSQYSFQYTIKFAGFNGEEQGLEGSLAYVGEIASEGEDVVGCFNLDMIAYRGNDPDPADVVIYTDDPSFPLADVLSQACIRYFPDDLGPTILIEPLGASDHASFWFYGYRAIVGSEDEAWGEDFSPWYHTSDDRIENYPTDYPTWVATSTIAAVAQTAIPEAAVGVRDPLRFELERYADLALTVFNAEGRRVRSLDSRRFERGDHILVWDGLDARGRPVSAGMYFLQLAGGGQAFEARVVRLR